jgi:hypothetical protein
VRPERRAPGPLPVAGLALVAVAVGATLPRLLAGPALAGSPPSGAARADCASPAAEPGDRPVGPCTVQRGDLLVTTRDGRPRAYRLGRAGDVFVVGDWDGDGVSTPGLYRPSSGEALEYGGWDPGADGAAPAAVLALPPGRTPSVEHVDGGDRITVR